MDWGRGHIVGALDTSQLDQRVESQEKKRELSERLSSSQ